MADTAPPLSLAQVAALATVPEHSLPLMGALGSGTPTLVDSYLFYDSPTALLAIGYPLRGIFEPEAFAAAIAQAQRLSRARECFAIAPSLPARMRATILETDGYLVLGTKSQPPRRLVNYAIRAAQNLTVSSGTDFSPAHRRLWAEFLERNGSRMNGRVMELYARAPGAVAQGSLTFLNAHDAQGNLAATLLLDPTPTRFTSYILGAHSRQFYVPHAMDLLFFELLKAARANGKPYIHLGLGVNEGIGRFKKKWGAVPSFPFVMGAVPMAQTESLRSIGHQVALAIVRAPTLSRQQLLQNEPEERPFAMLWRVEKNSRVSWLAGTAHFFYYSFASSFRKLFAQVDNVIFEGPLDAGFMTQVSDAGRRAPPGYKPLISLLTPEEIAALERMVLGPQGPLARLFAPPRSVPAVNVRELLADSLPWHAFFTLWTTFLERLGWRQSVDMEAWRIAQELDKNVVGMESLDEQLESLGSLPVERAVNFFRACATWPRRARQNLKAYLAGDLEYMMGSSAEFPTRTEHIVSRRDERFRRRMRPWLERGRAAVFVGSAHVVNLRAMLEQDGFTVQQAPLGLWPRLHLQWRRWRRPDDQVTW